MNIINRVADFADSVVKNAKDQQSHVRLILDDTSREHYIHEDYVKKVLMEMLAIELLSVKRESTERLINKIRELCGEEE